MSTSSRAGFPGAKALVRIAAAITLVAAGSAVAQDDAGITIDPNVLNVYLESRLKKPAEQATAEEAAGIRDELLDLYALSDQPRAQELAQSPRMQAQMELQRRGMLAQAVAQDFLTRNQASNEEMQALYAEQQELAPPEFKARHILVESQGEATALITELDGGADFEELAKAKSTGPSGPSGGDLGWFTADRMVPEFSVAVAQLGNGEYSKAPVQTQFGWHVILREDSRTSTPPPLESVSDVLKQQVEQRKLQEYLQSLRNAGSD